MSLQESPRSFRALYQEERDSIVAQLQQVGLAPALLEDGLQDFFLGLLETGRRSQSGQMRRSKLRARLQMYLRSVARPSHPLRRPMPPRELRRYLEPMPRTGIVAPFEHDFINRDQVRHYLQHMTEKSQLAVIVYYLLGLTRHELSKIWGVSANTVATQAHRGVKQAQALERGQSSPDAPSSPPTQTKSVSTRGSTRGSRARGKQKGSARSQARKRGPRMASVQIPLEWGRLPLTLPARSAGLIDPCVDARLELGFEPAQPRQRPLRGASGKKSAPRWPKFPAGSNAVASQPGSNAVASQPGAAASKARAAARGHEDEAGAARSQAREAERGAARSQGTGWSAGG